MQPVEKKLSKLESSAADILTTIESPSGDNKRSFTLTRELLGDLRKFIFIMHYRNLFIRGRFYGTEQQESLVRRRKKYMKDHGLKTVEDIWLHGLSYLLDTSHTEIVGEGEKINSRFSNDRQCRNPAEIDPDDLKKDTLVGNYFAIDYAAFANGYHIGVWEAADGSEFVMRSNSFATMEGSIMGVVAAIHCMFIISPRLALVLRINSFREAFLMHPKVFLKLYWETQSTLIDIHVPFPETHYPGNPTPKELHTAKDDAYKYTINKLSLKETQNVNDLILQNATEDACVVFSSKKYMLDTIHNHITSSSTPIQSFFRYAPLYTALNARNDTSERQPGTQ